MEPEQPDFRPYEAVGRSVRPRDGPGMLSLIYLKHDPATGWKNDERGFTARKPHVQQGQKVLDVYFPARSRCASRLVQ